MYGWRWRAVGSNLVCKEFWNDMQGGFSHRRLRRTLVAARHDFSWVIAMADPYADRFSMRSRIFGALLAMLRSD